VRNIAEKAEDIHLVAMAKSVWRDSGGKYSKRTGIRIADLKQGCAVRRVFILLRLRQVFQNEACQF